MAQSAPRALGLRSDCARMALGWCKVHIGRSDCTRIALGWRKDSARMAQSAHRALGLRSDGARIALRLR